MRPTAEPAMVERPVCRKRGARSLPGGLVLIAVLAGPVSARGPDPSQPATETTTRAADPVQAVNQAFLARLEELADVRPLAVQTIRSAWTSWYQEQSPESFVPDALAILDADYRQALEAFDSGRMEETRRLLEPLRRAADPFLAANARYFYARALMADGLLEEAEPVLRDDLADPIGLRLHTPYAAHMGFLLAVCQAANLRWEAAEQTLARLEREYPSAPEPVRVGARQLRLELSRRERGTLDEVGTLMAYSSARLKVADERLGRVLERQQEAVALLDRLIAESEQREREQGTGGGAARGGSRRPQGSPSTPREQSVAPAGEGRIGELRPAPRARPGEAWGRLPPAERERILQSLRDQYPSRYRQLVEQYYRALAEQK